MQTFFSYKPRSRSRIIAKQSTQQIAVVGLTAGWMCVGEFARFTFHSATPGKHYRGDACRFAKECVAAFGGLAEDACGAVTLCVPQHHAPDVLHLVRLCLPDADQTALAGQMWQQGFAHIVGADSPHIEMKPIAQACRLACVPGWRHTLTRDVEPQVWHDIPALWFFDADDATDDRRRVCVSDRGRHIEYDHGMAKVCTPNHPVGWMQIDGDNVAHALEILGIIPEECPLVHGYRQTQYGDLVEYAPGDEDFPAFIQIKRGHTTGGVWGRLLQLASQTNACCVTTPSWAGWVHAVVEPCSSMVEV